MKKIDLSGLKREIHGISYLIKDEVLLRESVILTRQFMDALGYEVVHEIDPTKTTISIRKKSESQFTGDSKMGESEQ